MSFASNGLIAASIWPARRRMEVILCTPTAAPPIWLIEEHPDILPRDEHGTPFRFGGRRHYSPTAPAMLEATIRIVTAMAQHFGERENVIAWQIDNELGSPLPGKFDQNEHAPRRLPPLVAREDTARSRISTARGATSSGTRTTRVSAKSSRAVERSRLRQPASCARQLALLVARLRRLHQATGKHSQAARRRTGSSRRTSCRSIPTSIPAMSRTI